MDPLGRAAREATPAIPEASPGKASVRPSFPIASLIRMIQVLPGITPAELLNSRRGNIQDLCPICGGMPPAPPGRIPVLQNGEGVFLGHAGMGRFLTLEPDVPPLPPAGPLDRPRKTGSRIPEAVMPNLVHSEFRKFPGDLGVGVPFFCEIPPDDYDCSRWFCHLFKLFWPSPGCVPWWSDTVTTQRISSNAPTLNRYPEKRPG